MTVLDEDTGKLLEYRQLRNHQKYAKIWNQSFTNEMGCLCQGVGKVPDVDGHLTKCTDTLFIVDL